MGTAQFRNNLRQTRSIKPTSRSAINQRRTRSRPAVSASQQNALIQAVNSLLSQSTSGGVGAMMDSSGIHLRSNPQRGSTIISQFGVVRDTGTEEGSAMTGEEHFIPVSPVIMSDTNPWDGQWVIDLEAVAEDVSCLPGLQAMHYAQFLYKGEAFRRDTPIVWVIKVAEVFVAFRIDKWMFPLQARNPNFRLSDCGASASVVAGELPPEPPIDPGTRVTPIEGVEITEQQLRIIEVPDPPNEPIPIPPVGR